MPQKAKSRIVLAKKRFTPDNELKYPRMIQIRQGMRNRVEKGNTKVKIELQASDSLMIALEKVFENLIEFPDKPVDLPSGRRAFHYPITQAHPRISI